MKIGDKFGKLTMIGEAFLPNNKGKNKKAKFRCECGVEKDIWIPNVQSGDTISCGCEGKKRRSENLTHRNQTRNGSGPKYKHSREHALYEVFNNMKATAKKNGSEVYEGWRKNWDAFYEWAIERWTEGYFLNRKDITKGFFPENCFFNERFQSAREAKVGASVNKGDKFGLLTAISDVEKKPHGKNGTLRPKVLFLCECGKEKEIVTYDVLKGKTVSCGCHKDKNTSERSRKYKKGICEHPLYQSYKSMRNTCYQPSYGNYRNGEVAICKEWDGDYKAFYDWAIDKWREDLFLTLKDRSKDYSPENCEFITKHEIANKIDKEASMNARTKTMVAKYGKEHAIQIKEFKDKRKETNILRYGYDCPSKNEEVKQKGIQTRCANGSMHFFDNMTIKQMAEKVGTSENAMRMRIWRYDHQTAMDMTNSGSALEDFFAKHLEQLEVKYKQQVRVENKYCDFVIDDKIAIELDGLYWHSDAVNKNNSYHKQKRDLYIKNGYVPLFFREDEIQNKIEIVKSIVKNKIKHKDIKRVFARKCGVQEITKEKAKEFFLENHLMGAGFGKPIALVLDDEIVACMQYISKSDFYDISRFATKINTSVVGGFSKLLNKIPKDKNIQTFIDRRYGQGKYLESLGFYLENCSLSFKWAKNMTVLNRGMYKGNSGYEHGFSKLWDCGQAKYVKKAAK